jgi:hypothetical protein
VFLLRFADKRKCWEDAGGDSRNISIPRSDLSRDRVIARVISRHCNPSQLGGNDHYGTFISFLIVKDRANIMLIALKDLKL